MPTTLLWNKLCLINNNRVYTPILAIRKQQNQLQTQAEDVEIFADHYYAVTQEDSYGSTTLNYSVDNQSDITTDSSKMLFTVVEVRNCIRTLKNFAPGPDGIYATMLKQFSYQHFDILTFFFNRIWQKYCFPTS